MKPILIGQAPGRMGDPERPLDSERIAKLFGLDYPTYLSAFGRINLLDHWPGKQGKGDAFPIREARAAAGALMAGILPGRTVLFVGRRVAEVFGYRGEYFKWYRGIAYDAVIVPHPSGINRWWNSRGNRTKAARFFRRLVSQ